jgi:hypothetical protein
MIDRFALLVFLSQFSTMRESENVIFALLNMHLVRNIFSLTRRQETSGSGRRLAVKVTLGQTSQRNTITPVDIQCSSSTGFTC